MTDWLDRLRADTGQRAARAAFLEGESARLAISSDGRVVFANAAARRIWPGGDPVAVLAASVVEDERAGEALARLRHAARVGVSEAVEVPLRGADGQADWYRVAVRSLGNGRGIRLWTAEEVTARHAIDEILLSEREELSDFLYFLPVGVYSADTEGTIRVANLRLAEWLGTRPDALVGRRIGEFILDGSAPQPESGWQGRLTLAGVGGRGIPVTVVQSLFDNAGETCTRSVVVRLDEDGAEPAARSDRRSRWLLARSPIGVAFVDLDGIVTDCNPTFARLVARDRTAIVDRALATVLSAEDAADIEASVAAIVLGRSSSTRLEVRLPGETPEGRERTGSANIGALGDPAADGEEIDGLVVHLMDTTEQRALEAQFAQAQKMQAMGQLAGGVAHDFNNLLTAMIGFSDLLLQRHGPGDPSFADIMQVKQNANRAANLVRQLLAFSRQQPLRPRLVDVTDALSELSHLLRRLLGETIALEMVHGRDLGLVRVDPGQFDQVIINLAVNARDAMVGGGRLIIRTEVAHVGRPMARGVETVPAGDYVVIAVADTGTGITPDNIGRIFEPFFTTKTSGGVGAGTGLGLSTVYGIVRQTDGFVFVDSVVGEGTIFTIYLPRTAAAEVLAPAAPPVAGDGATAAMAPAAPMVAPAADPGPGADLTGSATVLLVEDEDPVRMFAARALRNKGYTVLEAANGDEALALLDDAGEIDLLVSDMVMPGMDGATLADAVLDVRPGIRIILISGYSEDAARGALAEASHITFLAKPFSLKVLAETVKAVLAGDATTPMD